MILPLATPDDLEGFPGAPFAQTTIDAACQAVRDAARWVIAPQSTETLTVDADGGRVLLLPTMHLVSVSEVRDVTDADDPKVITGWRKSRAGMLELRSGCWPSGFETVEVDVVHGYEQCPASLLPLIAELCQMSTLAGGIVQESSGTESATYAQAARRSSALAPYVIPGRA